MALRARTGGMLVYTAHLESGGNDTLRRPAAARRRSTVRSGIRSSPTSFHPLASRRKQVRMGRRHPAVLRSRSLRTRNVWCRSRAPGAIRMRSSASPRRRGWRSRCRRPGIHARDRPLRQALTDDDHVVAVARVVVNEIATGNARHVQRGKESRRHADLAARRASRQIPGASRALHPRQPTRTPRRWPVAHGTRRSLLRR
jgi:hypothetical protein